MTIPAGTWLTFRVEQPLSSDRNQPGDAFIGTLAQPLVLNGLVLARPGATVSGRVVEAQKAPRGSGTSRLGIELTEIGLMDGQQIRVHTQMAAANGPNSHGRDAAMVGTGTATGAIIGAGVNGGVGAGVGAGIGLAASTLGVLLTRGRPTVLYPEQVLTFRLLDPVTVTADFNSGVFPPVQYYEGSNGYGPQGSGYGPQGSAGYGPQGYDYGSSAYAPAPAYPYYGYGYGYPYGYGYYPYDAWDWGWGWPWFGVGFYGGYWGPGYYGRGFYGRGYFGGRGFYGGGYRGGGYAGGRAVGGGFAGGRAAGGFAGGHASGGFSGGHGGGGGRR